MRMSALSATTGVPVPTVKYYIREGILHRGDLSGPNQATYDETHVRRLRLIRALIDVGGIGIAGARSVLTAIDSEMPVEQTFGIAQRAVSGAVDPAELDAESVARVDAAMEGWRVSPGNPGRLAAARALMAFAAAGQDDLRGWVDRYANAAMLVAAADLDEVDARQGRQEKAELVVIGTAIGDALFSGLRRAAQEHASAQRYLPEGPADPDAPSSTTTAPSEPRDQNPSEQS
jgi:DNA-binding transcriptional MerR regulator